LAIRDSVVIQRGQGTCFQANTPKIRDGNDRRRVSNCPCQYRKALELLEESSHSAF
jgi:hypothetical protein